MWGGRFCLPSLALWWVARAGGLGVTRVPTFVSAGACCYPSANPWLVRVPTRFAVILAKAGIPRQCLRVDVVHCVRPRRDVCPKDFVACCASILFAPRQGRAWRQCGAPRSWFPAFAGITERAGGRPLNTAATAETARA